MEKRKDWCRGRIALDEIDKHLTNPSVDVSFIEYPNTYKQYFKMNTGLSASTARERFVSFSGRVFTPLRSRLSGPHLEMVMSLRVAKW